MTWRVARSLDVLLAQLDAAYPNRSKASDGSIGDARHQAEVSDHNPVNGVVHARDYTQDPAHGLDWGPLSDRLVATRDHRIKYVIYNRFILDSRPQFNPWRWMPYSGPDPHTNHLHLSVVADPICDDTTPWAFLANVPVTPPPLPPAPGGSQAVGSRVLYLTNPPMSGADVKELQRVLNAWFPANPRLVTDGVFGQLTENAVKFFQGRAHLTVDGECGPATFRALHMI